MSRRVFLAFTGFVLAIALLSVPTWARTPTQHERIEAAIAAAHAKLDRIERLLGAGPVRPVDPVRPIDPPALPVACAGIDYSVVKGLTPQEILGGFGPFRGAGLPVGWSWACAYAAGAIDVDGARPTGPSSPPAVVIPAGVIPWNATAGEGRYIVVQGSMVDLSVIVPPAYSGKRQIVITQVPCAGSQYDTVSATVLGVTLGPSANSLTAWTPTLTGPATTGVRVVMAPAGCASVQLIGPQ